jgi:hypothetical protein
MSAELDLLEREVAAARSRLRDDFANLKAPGVANLKQDLTAGAEDVLTNIKDRLTANPVATAAIGAGVAWRLVQRPPVASLLVGYGLLSLWRTDPRQPSPMSGYAKQAVATGAAVADRMTRVAADAQSAAAETLGAVREAAAQSADSLKSTASERADSATRTARSAADALTQTAAATRQRAIEGMHDARDAARRDKDTYLLGFAAAALTAAIGISAQRRARAG